MERYVILHRPNKDGKSLYDHFMQLEESTGIWPDEYAPLDPPDGAEFIWDTYWELRNSASTGFNGPAKLNFSDFDAWERVREIKLSNDVIDAFLQMDATYITEWYREDPKKRTKSNAKLPVNRTKKHGR